MKYPPIRFGFDGAAAVPQVSAAVSGNTSGLTAEEVFGPFTSSVGPAVTDKTALQVGTVYACLEKLGGVVLQLPLHHYKLNAGGDRERVMPASPIWWMVNESPAPAWTAASWKEFIVYAVKLRGDQHTEILRGRNGEAVGLLPHHPDCVQVRTVDRRLRYDIWDPVSGKVYGRDQDDMLHFSGFGFNGERSVSAIKWAARNAISNSLSSATYMGKALGDHGLPKVAIEYPNRLDSEAARVVRESFVATYMGQQQRYPFVATQGGAIKPLNISAVDMEIMAARRMDKAEICEALGVPPIIIGDAEKNTSWGTGVEQLTLGWVRFGVKPMLARWEEELNRKLFRRAGQFLEFSLEALLRGDSKAQAEYFRAAVGGPGTGDAWMKVNEVRRLLNLPADPSPEADQLFRAQRSTTTSTGAPAQ